MKLIVLAVLGVLPLSYGASLAEFSLSFNGTKITSSSSDVTVTINMVEHEDWGWPSQAYEKKLGPDYSQYLCWDAYSSKTGFSVNPKEPIVINSVSISYALFNKDGTRYEGNDVTTSFSINRLTDATEVTQSLGTVTINLVNSLIFDSSKENTFDLFMGTTAGRDVYVGIDRISFNNQSVPESSSATLGVLGLGALLMRRRRQ